MVIKNSIYKLIILSSLILIGITNSPSLIAKNIVSKNIEPECTISGKGSKITTVKCDFTKAKRKNGQSSKLAKYTFEVTCIDKKTSETENLSETGSVWEGFISRRSIICTTDDGISTDASVKINSVL